MSGLLHSVFIQGSEMGDELKKENSVREGIAAMWVVAATLLVAYGVVLTSSFGVLDDYSFLWEGISGRQSTYGLLVSAGRPLNGLLLDYGFRMVGSVEGLTVLRALTLSGILLFGGALYFVARASRLGVHFAIAIACGAVLLPAFQVYVAWAQHFTTPYAGLLAVLGGALLMPSSRLYARSRVAAFVAATFLLVISILIYQPIAMVFSAVILMSMITAESSDEWRWGGERIIAAIGAIGAAMAIGFLVFKLARQGSVDNSARYGLVTDFSGKLTWFFSDPFPHAFSLFDLQGASAGIVISIVLVGLLAFWYRCGLKSFLRISLMGCLAVVGSYLPNLATAENWGAYRTTGALALLALVLFVMMVREILGAIGGFMPKVAEHPLAQTLGAVALGLLLLITAFRTEESVLKGFVLPNVVELDNLASLLRAQAKGSKNVDFVVVRPSSWMDSQAKFKAYDEFGMHSSISESYALNVVRVAVEGIGLFPRARIVGQAEFERISGGQVESAVIIDFSKLVSSQAFRSNQSVLHRHKANEIGLEDVNDQNWQAGVWCNQADPSAWSFFYKPFGRGGGLKIGQRLEFFHSGSRQVVRLECGGDYCNVLVDGKPLDVKDGYPNLVKILVD
jgi:hypothetical protein